MHTKGVPLLEVVMLQMQCSDSCDLKTLDKYQKKYLAGAINGVKEDSAPLDEWNELLRALGASDESNVKRAKLAVIGMLG